ncbi:hypothetical protein F5Y18DRAFT_229939 [Xylariaceae sp. FL1019]|nr:hypothetical protein F5Y18DRAFT_229939 [Xylariaceae sp. FL1019]
MLLDKPWPLPSTAQFLPRRFCLSIASRPHPDMTLLLLITPSPLSPYLCPLSVFRKVRHWLHVQIRSQDWRPRSEHSLQFGLSYFQCLLMSTTVPREITDSAKRYLGTHCTIDHISLCSLPNVTIFHLLTNTVARDFLIRIVLSEIGFTI